MKIKTEKEFIACRQAMEAIIQKGTAIGGIELLCEEDKEKYIEVSQAIGEWEAVYHPLPGRIKRE